MGGSPALIADRTEGNDAGDSWLGGGRDAGRVSGDTSVGRKSTGVRPVALMAKNSQADVISYLVATKGSLIYVRLN